jgi:hypothetical protein
VRQHLPHGLAELAERLRARLLGRRPLGALVAGAMRRRSRL